MSDPEICIYCGSYWRIGHTTDCAYTTGIFPVTEDEADIVCAECTDELDGFYTLFNDAIVCLGCAVRNLWL